MVVAEVEPVRAGCVVLWHICLLRPRHIAHTWLCGADTVGHRCGSVTSSATASSSRCSLARFTDFDSSLMCMLLLLLVRLMLLQVVLLMVRHCRAGLMHALYTMLRLTQLLLLLRNVLLVLGSLLLLLLLQKMLLL